MPIIPAPDSTVVNVTTGGPPADSAISFDVTLAAQTTSQVFLTVPVGKKLRSLSVVNRSSPSAQASICMVPDTAATLANSVPLIARLDALNLDNLDLPEGTYAFIGTVLNGSTLPRIAGIATVGDA